MISVCAGCWVEGYRVLEFKGLGFLGLQIYASGIKAEGPPTSGGVLDARPSGKTRRGRRAIPRRISLEELTSEADARLLKDVLKRACKGPGGQGARSRRKINRSRARARVRGRGFLGVSATARTSVSQGLLRLPDLH